MKKHNHNIPEKVFSAHPTFNTTYAYRQAALKQSATGSGGRISSQRTWVADWKRTATKAQCQLQVYFQVKTR